MPYFLEPLLPRVRLIDGLPALVGLSGAIGSGKDETVKYLAQRYGYVRLGMSDALKQEIAATIPRTLRAYLERVYPETLTQIGYDALVHRLLWIERDEFTRALSQEWGSELRRGDDKQYWVTRWARAYRDISDRLVVCPDVRFPNEAEVLRGYFGVILRIERPGREPGEDAHISETAVHGQRWDAVIQNAGTVGELQTAVDATLKELASGDRFI